MWHATIIFAYCDIYTTLCFTAFHVTHPPEEQRLVNWFSEKIILHSTHSLPYCLFKLGSRVSYSILPSKSTSWHVVSLLSPPSINCCLFLVSENNGVLYRESPKMARSTCDFERGKVIAISLFCAKRKPGL
jgi:hypothetical protein